MYALFAVSGFAGLIYESIWTHYLKLFLGHAAYAQTLVLAIFMGGMAIGSWLASRWSPRRRNLLAAYALTEAAIGALALVFHEVFTGATGLAFDTVLPRLASPAAIAAFKWTLSAALILPQSILLGTTFPLMTAGALRAFPERPGRSLAMLYFTNSLGAAAGVLVSGFFLVGAVGLPGTVRIAGAINLAVAAAVWRLFPLPAGAAGTNPAEARRDRIFYLFLGASLLTGASSFIYEVAWIRMLSLVLGASTHAFELMLSAFILGLALGGLWIQRRIDALPDAVRTLGIVQLAMGLFALATLIVYGRTFQVMSWLVLHLHRTEGGYALFNLSSNAIAIAVMLPATFCAGTTLPLITFHLLRRGCGEASIGAVYAANTVGAIIAVFFAIHLGMPLLGLKGLLVLGAAIDIALGIALLPRLPVALAGAAAVALTVAFVHLDPYQMASGVYRVGALMQRGTIDILFHRDGKTATVSILSALGGTQLSILTNGKSDASVTMPPDKPPAVDEPTMTLAAVLPMSLMPEARTAACIGLGSGLTTHTLLLNPALQQVDTIEIEEEMVRAATRFRPRNELAYTDPRGRIHIDDAKTFFSTHAKKYDIVVSEPSNPWVSGVAGLFSDEFYKLVRRHLNEGALFVQWIQLYEMDVDLVVSVLKALEANFSDYQVYAPSDLDAILVAKNGGTLATPDLRILTIPSIAASLRRLGLERLQDFDVRLVGTRSSWEGLSSSFNVPMNSDYRPYLDQNAVRARFLDKFAGALVDFEREPLPAVEMLGGIGRPWTITNLKPSFDVARTMRAHKAILLRDGLAKRAVPQSLAGIDPELDEQAKAVVAWLRACSGKPLPLTQVLSVAQAMLPDVTPAELDAIWRGFESAPCAKELSARDRVWLQFLETVGRRDPKGMAAGARLILASEQGLRPRSMRYLVAAGMLGSIVSGDRTGARELWSRHPVDLSDDLLLRVLVARTR